MNLNGHKPTAVQASADHSWILTVSDKGVTLSLSSEAIKSCGQTIRAYAIRVLPWVMTVLIAASGGTAGVRIWLLQQQGTPTISPTEDVLPQP
jgi:hypothetical protein